ncbi:hypothetical protein ACJX0J_024110, partial [Zea mays]
VISTITVREEQRVLQGHVGRVQERNMFQTALSSVHEDVILLFAEVDVKLVFKEISSKYLRKRIVE